MKLHSTWYEWKDFVFVRPLMVRYIKLLPTVDDYSAYVALWWALMGVADIVGVQSLSPDSEWPNCLEIEIAPYGSS